MGTVLLVIVIVVVVKTVLVIVIVTEVAEIDDRLVSSTREAHWNVILSLSNSRRRGASFWTTQPAALCNEMKDIMYIC